MLRIRDLLRPGLGPVSFDVAAGECLAVRGPSGSGKTLLLRAIADLDPNTGAVTLDGTDRDAMPAPEWRKRVGYLPAEPGWWADTVADHFADWAAVEDMVRTLGLDRDMGEAPVARLSTGERQRLALVRALAVGPTVLLLDEPTAALDDSSRDAVEALLAARRDAGAALVWVTHDSDQAKRVTQRGLRVADGTVSEAAAP